MGTPSLQFFSATTLLLAAVTSLALAMPFNLWGSWTVSLRRVALIPTIMAVPLIVDLYVRNAVALTEDRREILDALLADFEPPSPDGLLLLIRLFGLVIIMIGLTRLYRPGRLASTAGPALILASFAWRGI